MLQRCLGIIILCLTLPISAYANAGTPLMWAGFLHLVVGNAFIGFAEGLACSAMFNGKKRFWIPIMILANYFSAWLGAWFIKEMVEFQPDINLYNAVGLIWKTIGLTLILSIVIEWPFVAFGLFRHFNQQWKKSLWVHLLIQLTSYAAVFGWYYGASRNSLFTKVDAVPPSSIKTIESGRLYFISKEDGDIYSVKLDGSQLENAFTLKSTNWNDRLIVEEQENKKFDLLVRWDDRSDDARLELLATNRVERCRRT